MRSLVLALVAVFALSSAAVAQNSTLALNLDPSTGDLTANLSGAPADTRTFIAFGQTPGSTSLFGGNLMLGLDRRFRFIPVGATDMNGDLTFTSARIPMRAMAGTTLHFQAVSVDVTVTRPTTPTTRPTTRPTRHHRRAWPRPVVTYTFTTSNVAAQAF